MNEIANKSLIAGDIFMPEIHLRKPQSIFRNIYYSIQSIISY